eukprot:gene9904-2226_t
MSEVNNKVSIVDANTGTRIEVDRPSDIDELKQQITKTFQIQEDEITTIKTLLDKEITKEDMNNQETFVFFNQNEEISGNIDNEVSIIPHINILLHSGDEYDFTTALAEIVDNSVQNTVQNEHERRIEINFTAPTKKNKLEHHTLDIWDNGIGMNFEGLKTWATMGVTESIKPKNVVKKKTNVEKYLTSDFSRYGVGSKKAIFNIGSEVTVTSKEKNSRWVYEVSLSKKKLEEEYSKNLKWKTNVITRAPKNESEKSVESFTLITIGDMNPLYYENYNSQFVRRDLSSIYHYYIHGSKGNKSSSTNDSMEIEDSDSDSENIPLIDIKVDGKSLKKNEEDLESLYLQLGKNPFVFNFTVSAKGSDTVQLSQSSQNRVFSKVQGIIYYYPYVNGQETLPIPFSNDEDDIPLSERNPGFECFWNGRLLSNEKISSIPFMKGKKTHEIPDHCHRRIKGMLFLDSNFEVSANKMYLCKQTPLSQAMLNYDDRNLSMKFKKWLKDCHAKFDEEIVFEEKDSVLKSTADKIYYSKIKFRGLEVKKGDKVFLKKPKLLGEIANIYRDTSQESYGCLITINEWNTQNEERPVVKPISSLDKILAKSEFREQTSKMKNKLPSYIDIVDTPDVDSKFRRPPSDPVDVGYILKYITVAVYSGDHKVVSKIQQGMLLQILHQNNYDDSQKEISSLYSEKPYKEGRYCFKIHSLKPPEFIQAGKYIFKFKSDIPDIKEKSFVITVNPGPAVFGELQEEIADEVKVGDTIPQLTIHFMDQYENYVEPKFKLDDVKIAVNKKDFEVNEDFQVMMENDALIVTGLKISSGKIMKSEPIEKINLEVLFGTTTITTLEIPLSICAGNPTSVQLTKESLVFLESSLISKILPPIKLISTDCSGNRLYLDDELICTASGEFLKEEFTAKLKDGEFEFSELTKNNIVLKDEIETSMDLKLTFSLNCKPTVKTSCTVTLDPNLSQPLISKIRILPTLSQKDFLKSNHSKDAEIDAVVYTELIGWKAEVVDENGCRIDFAGYVSFNWDKGDEIRFENGVFQLPALTLPPTPKKLNHKFKIQNSEYEFTFKLKINSIIGPPLCFVNNVKNLKKFSCATKFSLSFSVHDEFGNAIDINLHSDLYQQIKDIKPVLQILPPENGENISFQNKDDWILDINQKGGFKWRNVMLVGDVGEYTMIIKDEGGIVKEVRIPFTLEPGEAKYLQINNNRVVEYSIPNFSKTPELWCTVHDTYGNVIDDGFQFEFCPNENILFTPDKHNPEIRHEEGNHILPIFFIRAEQAGKYSSKVNVKEYEDIESAEFILNVLKSDHPYHLRIYAFGEEIGTITEYSVQAGVYLGEIMIEVIGENDSTTKAPNPIQMLVIEPNKSKKIYHSSFSSQTQTLKYFIQDTQDYQFSKVGIYSVEFRLDISSLAYYQERTQKALKHKMDIEVLPGDAFSIEIDDGFMLPAVSNTSEDIDKRSLWDEVTLYVVDKMGNRIKDYSGNVEIKIISESKKMKIPKLEGKLSALIRNGLIHFDRISIEENSDSDVGNYTLCIQSEGLQSKELSFTYFDDENLRKEQNELQNKIQNLEHKIEEMENEIEELESIHRENERKSDTIQQQIDEQYGELKLHFKHVNEQIGIKEINQLIEKVKRKIVEKKNLEKGSSQRKAVYSKDELIDKVNNLKQRDEGIIGFIADLGFIDDEVLDKTIAPLFGKFINALVVDNTETADRLRKDFSKSKFALAMMPLDNINKQSELNEDGSYPFRDINDQEGALGHAINLIELKKEQFEIRYVFYSLIGDTIVFDTYENALAYRQRLLMQKKRCPTIVTMDGDKLEQTGVVYAGKKQESKNRFGQLPLLETKTYLDLKMKKETLERYKSSVSQKEKFDSNDLAESETNLERIRKKYFPKIEKLKVELEKLRTDIVTFGIPTRNINVIPDDENSDIDMTPRKRKKRKIQQIQEEEEINLSPEIFSTEDW